MSYVNVITLTYYLTATDVTSSYGDVYSEYLLFAIFKQKLSIYWILIQTLLL